MDLLKALTFLSLFGGERRAILLVNKYLHCIENPASEVAEDNDDCQLFENGHFYSSLSIFLNANKRGKE